VSKRDSEASNKRGANANNNANQNNNNKPKRNNNRNKGKNKIRNKFKENSLAIQTEEVTPAPQEMPQPEAALAPFNSDFSFGGYMVPATATKHVNAQVSSYRQDVEQMAPKLFSYRINSPFGPPSFALLVNDDVCMVANDSGMVYVFDHEFKLQKHYSLPSNNGVKCLVEDRYWIYAGCMNGKVYDLSQDTPRLAYTLPSLGIICGIELKEGILAVSDNEGNLAVVNYEGDKIWSNKSLAKDGWLCLADQSYLYHGHSKGINKYEFISGIPVWFLGTDGAVQYGTQTKTHVIVCTDNRKIYCIDKDNETIYRTFTYNWPTPTVFCCCLSTDEKFLYAATRNTITCFDFESGEYLWTLRTGVGYPMSMKCHKDRLYVITQQGFFACIDLRDESINAALCNLPQATVEVSQDLTNNNNTEAVPSFGHSSTIETTHELGNGVLVECFREPLTQQLKVRPVYAELGHPDWNIQFPTDIREEGARYVVDELVEARDFYRVRGDIKKYVETE